MAILTHGIHEIMIAPHSSADPLGIVAGIHVMATTPNFLIMEFGGGTGESFFKEPLQMTDGYVELPEKPGGFGPVLIEGLFPR